MIYYYSHKLIQAFQQPQIGIPACLTIGIILLIYLNVYKANNSIKVTSITLFWTYLLLYAGFYIGGLVIIRYLQLGSHLDLKKLITALSTAKDAATATPFSTLVNSLVCTIMILVWFLIMWKIRKRLEHKICSLYLYYKYYGTYMPRPSNTFIWCESVAKSLWKFDIFSVLTYLCRKVNKKIDEPMADLYRITYTVHITLLLILVIGFIVEISLNNWSIHYITYYLFVYIILMTYIRISYGISLRDCATDNLLVRRAYSFPEVVYINLTEWEEMFLEAYIKYPRYIPEAELKNFLIHVGYGYVHAIEANRQFILNDNTINPTIDGSIVYHNAYLDKVFEPSDLMQIDGKYFVDDEDNLQAMEYLKKLKAQCPVEKVFKQGANDKI